MRLGIFPFPKYLATVSAAMLLQAAANFINDYYDFVKSTDLDNWETPDAFGPSLVIRQGLLTPARIPTAGLIALMAGSAVGLAYVCACGWPVLILGLVEVFGSYFYTATAQPRVPWARRFDGPGNVFGAYCLQALEFSWPPALAGSQSDRCVRVLCKSTICATSKTTASTKSR
jgi:1,4-dihydroxy-2-naphthoate octaprenyltransferase